MRFSLEMVTVPVADVDRAKAFYVERLGFQEDMDIRTDDGRRFVRLTPPGSVCCVAIGEGWVDTQPGSVKGTQLVVDDIDTAQALLHERARRSETWLFEALHLSATEGWKRTCAAAPTAAGRDRRRQARWRPPRLTVWV